MKIKVICLLFILLGTISAVSAHGVDVTNQSTIVIADNSTGVLAKKVTTDMGLNISVYKFKSADEVTHQLEHSLTNSNKRILAVAYQDTVNDFLAKNPTVSNRIFVSSGDEMDIKNGLTLLTSNNNTGFLTPLFAGLLVGIMAGLGLGAFWMKKKLS
ncbi:MAG: hypothetical protein Q8M97_00220 [Methanobacteriaceae archaeon]|nr:hypothetical protein [Methanobacteriaceae archaeon]MDP3485006.1 hypothetical protein [Methanobacteriaceae archaeon]